MADSAYPTQSELETMAARLGELLQAQKLSVATAESCTGGWVAQCLTAIAGSSAWFDRGFVTYSNQAKMDMLGISVAVLQEHGAVSEPTAVEMANGALQHSQADWALSITGIAGPTGGSAAKPVGTVCFAWVTRGATAVSSTRCFVGDRLAVRAQAVAFALEQMHGKII